ncbi:LysR substrate-binding domain-containing protein [Streptomyces sp. NRRL S-1868]|uniref:LysR substrate-binding domain-containing protein n=1 Tax=Streptomyces sp. NRRL S-1868 TaxID=1463892 RepID=UPI00068B3A9C|nr:LysR substrate-binding domain-containing protein [Streptomyces sp. NRRL S-1868]
MDLLSGRLKLRHLVLVVAIAEHGSVLRAAEHLHLAQPAVTRSLREVETLLGVELFTRGPRGTVPTVFGEAFLEHARGVLAELRHAGERLTGLADAAVGTVTVGTLLAGSGVLLPRAIAALKRDRPGVTVVVREATFDFHVPRLLDGGTDLVVGRLNPIDDQPGLRQIGLCAEPVRLVARPGHPARTAERPTLAGLLAHPWVLPLEQTSLRRELTAVFRAQGLGTPENLVECTSILTVCALVRETDMIAALPEHATATDPGVVPLPVELPGVHQEIGVTLPERRRLTPSAHLLLQHLRREAERYAEQDTASAVPGQGAGA